MMKEIESTIQALAEGKLLSCLPICLIGMGIFFACYLGFFPLSSPKLLFSALFGIGKAGRNTSGVSPFRAVTLALAGTLGVGNLVGVAGAIAIGGPGSIFWMFFSALFGMFLKYAEIVLAKRHIQRDGSGAPYGGAMYYIKDFLSSHGLPRIGLAVSVFFALFSILNALTMGSVIQMNAVGAAFSDVFSMNPFWIGGIAALVTLLLTLSGGKKISAVTEKLVPLMTLIYLLLSLLVLVRKREAFPSVFLLILRDAFSLRSAVGGFFAFFSSRALRLGVMRGLLSNEAGCGTAPMAHAESEGSAPAEQGIWGVFEVFADTILLCTLTAAVILVTYGEGSEMSGNGMLVTITAYSAVLGKWVEPVFAVLVLFFAFATVICWGHYGALALRYLSSQRWVFYLYCAVYALSAFFGTVSGPEIVFSLSDLALAGMTYLNLFFLFCMRREIREETLRWKLYRRK